MARILIAEDDAHILRILSMWLTRNGHEVVETSDGLKAKEALSHREVDLVVSDVNMPGLDGNGLVRWLRSEHGCNVPIILLSSRSDHVTLGKDLEPFGVRLHPKPFSPSRLVVEIERLLSAAAEATESA